MIGTALVGVVLIFFLIASFLDLKYKAVPSVILTGLMFVVLIMRPEKLIFGVIMMVFAIMIKDLISDVAGLDFGVADIKVFVIMGLLLTNFQSMIILIIVFMIYQFAYTILWRWKVSKEDEMPFIPCLTAVFIAMILIRGVA